MQYISTIGVSSRRRRSKLKVRTLIGGGFVLGLMAATYTAYKTGRQTAQSELTGLRQQSSQLIGMEQNYLLKIAELEDSAKSEQAKLVDLQARYENDVPSGDARDLYHAIQLRIKDGVSTHRILQVLKNVQQLKPCATGLERRRYAMERQGAALQDYASFLDGLVKVKTTIVQGDKAERLRTTVQAAWLKQPLEVEGLPANVTLILDNLALHMAVRSTGMYHYVNADLTTCAR